MERITDFKPLERLTLPDLGDLKCSGLIVLVGPNSSGKSQLLQDVYRRIAGEPRKLVVAQDISILKPPLQPFLDCLEREGYFLKLTDDQGRPRLMPQTIYLGTGGALGEIQYEQAAQWYNTYSPESPNHHRRQSEFLGYFGRLMVTGLFLERRLSTLTQAGVIDFLNQPPQHDLHALFLDDTAKQRLFDEMLNTFGRGVWPDTSRGNHICLKVSEEGRLPPAEDRLSPKRMAEFRSIETEGDGMKSYAATCVSLLLGSRPVCLIDEPEMCLHPPQAYNLGRFIGRFGTGAETSTIVATHSSHLLRGILQTASSVQIVRLTRRDQRFSAHLVPSTVLAAAVERPTVRAESVLDGIFARGVIVLESDTDRVVYQATWETLVEEFKLDIHFSTVGGTGGIADTVQLYRTLRIPVCVIADLDVIVDREKMKRVLNELVSDETLRNELLGKTRRIAETIRKLPPVADPKEIVGRLQEMGSRSLDWDRGDDSDLKKSLTKMIHEIDRMRRLKRGGISAFPEEFRKTLEEALHCLQEIGLYVVPVGELEEWFGSDTIRSSKNNKWAWANEASAHILRQGRQDGGIWAFIKAVGQYLASTRSLGH